MQSPYNLFISNKSEFLEKLCALCISPLYYPEVGDKMPNCCKLGCEHIFHTECLNLMFQKSHQKCPECREPVAKIVNMDKSLELAIRHEAFENQLIDERLMEQFSRESVVVRDYAYHKLVFDYWKGHKGEK